MKSLSILPMPLFFTSITTVPFKRSTEPEQTDPKLNNKTQIHKPICKTQEPISKLEPPSSFKIWALSIYPQEMEGEAMKVKRLGSVGKLWEWDLVRVLNELEEEKKIKEEIVAFILLVLKYREQIPYLMF